VSLVAEPGLLRELDGRPLSDELAAPALRSPRELARVLVETVGLLWRAGRLLFVAALVLQAVGGLATGASLLLVRTLVGRLLEAGAGLGTLLGPLVLLAAVLAVLGVAIGLQRTVIALLAEEVAEHADREVAEVAGAAPLAAFDDPAFHDLVRRAQDAGDRAFQLTQGFLALSGSLAALLGVLGFLAVLQPLLVPVLLAGLVPLLVSARAFGRELHRTLARLSQAEARRSYVRRLLLSREAAAELRAFGLVPHLHALAARLFEQRRRAMRRVARRGVWRTVLGSAGVAAAVALTLGIVLWLVAAHALALPVAAAAAVAVVQVGPLLNGLGQGLGQVHESALFLADHRALRDAHAGVAEASPAVPASPFARLDLEHVTFSYPGTAAPAVRDVSLGLRSGEIVALVGENGSGKTTVAKLAAGLYEPASGRVVWDGGAPDRASVAWVFQDFARFHFRAHTAVALGRPEAPGDREAVERAAALAGAHELLASLPEGYETPLGAAFAGGADLSPGQWQRLALARAVFRDAPVVILDEPTAALDPRAEHELLGRLRSLFAGRAVLLISHRLSCARVADRICVMEGGAVVEEGTHAELLAQGGRYAELFAVQSAGYV
jgi:ATP-binding cassette subfamily B protein